MVDRKPNPAAPGNGVVISVFHDERFVPEPARWPDKQP